MPDYVELHTHSCYSLLDGASSPEALVKRAFELRMGALALTDHDAVYGAVRFVRMARACGIRPILGAELTLQGDHHLTLLVENQAGWQNLCYLISRARQHAPKGFAALPTADLPGHTDGLIALSGCRQGEVCAALLRGDWTAARSAARRYMDLFGPANFWIELQHHLMPDDNRLVYKLDQLGRRLGIACAATNNVHYAVQNGHELHDVLVCIKNHTTLDEAGPLLRSNSEYYLKSAQEMAPLFADYPAALSNTCVIAERCQFELNYGLQDLPRFPTPDGLSAEAHLRALCEAALPIRFPVMTSTVQDHLNHELDVINRSGLANYFLIVWDIVRFSREQGIRCQGRGSAANSLVAYLLGISPIDPLAHGLVFERFLSDERQVAPDIDIDFQADRREEVIQYVYGRYGTDHAAMACTLVTFRARSALREVGKTLGFSLPVLAQASKVLDAHGGSVARSVALQEYLGKNSGTLPWQQLTKMCGQIAGLPRHLGIHNGGMVIMGVPLAERVPTEPATMPDRVVIQWDKDSLEDAGLIKIDILGLRMLSAIAKAVKIIEETTGKAPDLDALTFDDPAVYEMISRADTIGVFQVESRAQTQVLPRLRPAKFEDLIISISLIRPGPIQGNMVHPYLRRRLGKERVTYPHLLLKPSLQETHGVILFQEQVLKVARDLAAFTPGQGEQLRRALGSKESQEAIDRFHNAFLTGAQGRGVTRFTAEAVFGKLRAFGSYSFPKSHAAAFAVLVYQSAWLKRYHPAAFLAGLLNNQPMGFYSPSVLVNDARRHGIQILPVDVNHSRARCTVEGGGIRLGFRYVDGLGDVNAATLESAQAAGPFTTLPEFCRRTRLPKSAVENLILAGAMDAWGLPRRHLFWTLGQLRYHRDELDLIFDDEDVDLPPLSEQEKLDFEYTVLGLSTGNHVMTQLRAWLSERGIIGTQGVEAAPAGTKVRVAGLLVIHQAPPTAKGFHFLTLEDEAGMMNIIVRPDVYAKYRRVLRDTPLLVFDGIIQRQESVVNVVATGAARLTYADHAGQPSQPIPPPDGRASSA